jgi:hypothetical protein
VERKKKKEIQREKERKKNVRKVEVKKLGFTLHIKRGT